MSIYYILPRGFILCSRRIKTWHSPSKGDMYSLPLVFQHIATYYVDKILLNIFSIF